MPVIRLSQQLLLHILTYIQRVTLWYDFRKRFRYMRIFRLQQKLKAPTPNFVKSFQWISYSYMKTARPVETIDVFFFSIQLRSHNMCSFWGWSVNQIAAVSGLQSTVYAHLFTHFYFIKYLLTILVWMKK